MSTGRVLVVVALSLGLGLFLLSDRSTGQEQAAAPADAPAFAADPAHSSVVFRIKHMDTAYIYGMFTKMTGMLRVGDDNVPRAVEMTIDASSVFTGVEARDKHLRSGDFFGVTDHPAITFVSRKIEPAADATDGLGSYTVTGDLTLMGQTRTITAGLNFTGRSTNPRDNKQRVGVESIFTIRRSDFGMTTGIDNKSIGDDVTLMVGIEAIRQ